MSWADEAVALRLKYGIGSWIWGVFACSADFTEVESLHVAWPVELARGSGGCLHFPVAPDLLAATSPRREREG